MTSLPSAAATLIRSRRRLLLLATVLALASVPGGAAPTPPAAPTPEASFARFVAEHPPARLEERVARTPERQAELLAPVLAALEGEDAELAAAAGAYLAASLRHRAERVAAAPPWSEQEAFEAAALAVGDPARFVADPGFRSRVLGFLPRALDAGVDIGFRRAVLRALYTEIAEPPLADALALEAGWGVATRDPRDHRTPFRPGELAYPDETTDAVAASIFSLPSRFFSPPEVTRFLAAVRRAAPERRILVFSDGPLLRELEVVAAELRVDLQDTFGLSFTPWPRDPFSLVERAEGGLLVVETPGVGEARWLDAGLGRELVQNLPADLVRAWGGVSWTRTPYPFHNGHVLFAGGEAWLSIHALEPRILEVLGLDRVPVASFDEAAGIARYLGAARRAAAELEALYGKPVRFVHPLPESGPAAERSALMRRLGSGAGFDLDSLLTLLPGPDGGLVALVGDLEAGRSLAAGLDAEGREALRREYGLTPPPPALPGLLARAQDAPPSRRLADYLDMVAEHLAASGLQVRRIALLLVPTSLLAASDRIRNDSFLLGWNNVVLDPAREPVRAEGFDSPVPEWDETARAVFAEAGVELVSMPALVPSVIRGGGYRCASNEIRSRPPREEEAPSPLALPPPP